MLDVHRVRQALAGHEPSVVSVDDGPRAAVAMLLAERPEGPEVLFIERAQHPQDPWSGHMAFPGGRVDPHDPGGRAAAERETEEEVGVSLRDAEPLGRLDDLRGNPRRHGQLVISAFVYRLDRPAELRINHEVNDAFWFPLSGLLDPARHVQYVTASELEFPGILVGEPDRHVVWGLTYRFLESFFGLVGAPFPDRWNDDARRYTVSEDRSRP